MRFDLTHTNDKNYSYINQKIRNKFAVQEERHCFPIIMYNLYMS
jgi:hypothetical protein